MFLGDTQKQCNINLHSYDLQRNIFRCLAKSRASLKPTFGLTVLSQIHLHYLEFIEVLKGFLALSRIIQDFAGFLRVTWSKLQFNYPCQAL